MILALKAFPSKSFSVSCSSIDFDILDNMTKQGQLQWLHAKVEWWHGLHSHYKILVVPFHFYWNS